MVEEVMDARRPNTQENGRDMVTAPVPILPTCKKVKNINENTIYCSLFKQKKINKAYQKLLEKTKIGKHADNDKNRNFLPNPNKDNKTKL